MFRFIQAVANENYIKQMPNTPVNVVIFISTLTEKQAQSANKVAQPLYNQNVLISLVGLSNTLDESLVCFKTGQFINQWI